MIIRKIIKTLFSLITTLILIPFVINAVVIGYGAYHIIDFDEAGDEYDCIIVPGCSVIGNTPSGMLKARLDRAIELYEKGAAYRILMTGDRDDEYYDEVSVMREYAISRGVPPVAVMIDPYGYSTYESMYRAERDFEVEKALVVTQRYHLYRSVYDARLMGIKADGVVCVSGNTDIEDSRREFLARIKDFVYTILRPEPETIQEYRLENPKAAAQFQ